MGDKVLTRLEQSKLLFNWLGHHVPTNVTPGNSEDNWKRVRFAGSVLYVAFMHYRGILTLLSDNNPTSAFALVRLYFDAYVRGVWLHRRASQGDLDDYGKDKHSLAFGDMVLQIEELEGFNGGTLSSIKTRSWKAMNSYAHTGYQQVARHNTPTDIGPSFEDDEVLELLRASDAFAIMIAQEMLLMAGDLKTANELTERMKKI